jgi:trehalose-6-phosphate synthase
MEFTLAKQQTLQLGLGSSFEKDQGVVIMSEFMSSARVMRGAITVNPWNVTEVLNLSFFIQLICL